MYRDEIHMSKRKCICAYIVSLPRCTHMRKRKGRYIVSARAKLGVSIANLLMNMRVYVCSSLDVHRVYICSSLDVHRVYTCSSLDVHACLYIFM
jgi:hypothetical protein